jgi:drug/metabolite transporter (DMT)-like permease
MSSRLRHAPRRSERRPGAPVTPHPLADWIRLLALTLMWGSAFLLTKIAVSALDPDLVVAGRLLVACLLLVPLALLRPTRGGPGGSWGARLWLFLLLIAVFGNALPFTLVAWGQQRVDSGLAGILMAVMPLATLGLSHYLVPGERLTPYRVAGFLFGFLGVLVLLGPDALRDAAEGEGNLLPMLAVLAGALCYAISAILARLRPPSGALPSAAATTLLATGLMLPFVLGPGDRYPGGDPTVVSLAAVLALGAFSTAWASILYFQLIKSAGPAFVSQLNYLIPLWAVAVGMVFLGERPEPNALYALALILVGVLLTQMERRRAIRRRPPDPPRSPR